MFTNAWDHAVGTWAFVFLGRWTLEYPYSLGWMGESSSLWDRVEGCFTISVGRKLWTVHISCFWLECVQRNILNRHWWKRVLPLCPLCFDDWVNVVWKGVNVVREEVNVVREEVTVVREEVTVVRKGGNDMFGRKWMLSGREWMLWNECCPGGCECCPGGSDCLVGI